MVSIFGVTVARTTRLNEAIRQKGLQLAAVEAANRGWFPIVREPFAGAWQQNVSVELTDVLTFAAVYACLTLIASDIGKTRLMLVEDAARQDIWTETTSPAFSPVLRKPNRYQTRIQFLQTWITSKYIHGNTYVIKERDQRGVVVALYVLEPTKVKVLIAEDGGVYYELKHDRLSSLDEAVIVVPAREIIHDVCVPLYHPLVGVSPITACGLAAVQGLKIQETSALFFQNGAQPGGIITAPGTIPVAVAERLKERWETKYGGDNSGKVAILGDGLTYEPIRMTSVDAQLIEQLKWTAENVCTAFHVPPYMVGVGPPPNYNNIEALNQQYYAQTLQNPMESIELLLEDGLDVPDYYGIEFDLLGLIRMDTAAKTKAAGESIKAGMSPNEVRRRFHNLGPVRGGEVPYLQEQNWPITQLAARELPTRPPTPPVPALPAPIVDADEGDVDDDPANERDVEARFTVAFDALRTKALGPVAGAAP